MINTLEDNFRHVIADIRPQKLQKVVEIWSYRLKYIGINPNGYLPKLILKHNNKPLFYNQAKLSTTTLNYMRINLS